MQGCKPFNFIEQLRELPWEVLATVDFSCDANLSNMSLRAQQTEDSKLAAANNETFIMSPCTVIPVVWRWEPQPRSQGIWN